eukprot:349881-Chlamydomonas_euryale.AAC.1
MAQHHRMPERGEMGQPKPGEASVGSNTVVWTFGDAKVAKCGGVKAAATGRLVEKKADLVEIGEVTTLESSASASRMDQTGSNRSYLTSTTARCRKDRKAQGPEKDRTKERKLKEKGRKGEKKDGNGPEEKRSLAEKD